MRKCRLLLLGLCLLQFGCETAKVETAETGPAPASEPSRYDRVYFLEHRQLPQILEEDQERFFNALAEDGTSVIRYIWNTIVGEDGLDAISTEHEVISVDRSIVFIQFPAPSRPVECYAAAVVRNGMEFQYITLEMTTDILGDGTKTCLCEWKAGSHINYGPRNYADLDAFRSEVLTMLLE